MNTRVRRSLIIAFAFASILAVASFLAFRVKSSITAVAANQRMQGTLARMSSDACALELHYRRTGSYPLPGFIGTARALESTKIDWFCGQDGWRRPMFYSSSSDGKHYVLVSFGEDGLVDAESVSGQQKATPDRDGVAADIVYSDGVPIRFNDGFTMWEYSPRDLPNGTLTDNVRSAQRCDPCKRVRSHDCR